MNTVKIDGVDYVRADSVRTKDAVGALKIVVLQRGWVLVGELEKKGTDCKLHGAAVVRVWGTTKGLGEIAVGGPTSSTKLDVCGGVVSFDWLTVVFTLDCDAKAWTGKL